MSKNEISTSEDSFMIAKKCFGKSFLKIIHIMDGAKEDLINAERLLRKYLVEYCFDDELGIVPISSINVSLLAGTDVNNQVLNRIKELLNKFYEETKKIITEHKDMVTEMAEIDKAVAFLLDGKRSFMESRNIFDDSTKIYI